MADQFTQLTPRAGQPEGQEDAGWWGDEMGKGPQLSSPLGSTQRPTFSVFSESTKDLPGGPEQTVCPIVCRQFIPGRAQASWGGSEGWESGAEPEARSGRVCGWCAGELPPHTGNLRGPYVRRRGPGLVMEPGGGVDSSGPGAPAHHLQPVWLPAGGQGCSLDDVWSFAALHLMLGPAVWG